MPETVRFRFTSPVTYRGLVLSPGSEAEVTTYQAERWEKKGIGVVVGEIPLYSDKAPLEGENVPILTTKKTKKRATKKKQGRSTE